MGFAENRGEYWRGRYKAGPGKYLTIRDEAGAVIRFRTRRAAEQAANDKEAAIRSGASRPRLVGRMTFGQYADIWYARQDLAASTMQNYRRRLEEHLLPVFGESQFHEITRDEIAAWEKKERAAGYAGSSISSWRNLLHLVLADAVDDQLSEVNPAARRKGRGKRAGGPRTGVRRRPSLPRSGCC